MDDDEGNTHDDDDVDRQFRALMEGLRTSLPGVQVLFAFLLIAPLQSDFDDFVDVEHASFIAAFYSAGIATVLLIAPSVHQRLRAPSSGLQRRSKHHLIIATWITIAGTVAMGCAIASTTLLVSSLVFDGAAVIVAATVLTVTMLWAWIYVPLVSFRRV